MKIAVIGSSTGGPRALETVLLSLPKDLNIPVVVIQHLTETFTDSMTSRLNARSNMPILKIEHGQKLLEGNIYVVPGGHDFFLLDHDEGQETYLMFSNNTLTPSIDAGFTSIAERYGKGTLGVILTGMGQDGTKGAKAVKQFGGRIIVQNEETSAVYGMPKSVKDHGFADKSVPLDEISKEIIAFAKK